MSTEKILSNEKKDLAALITPEASEKSINRVDINVLLARVIKEKKEEIKQIWF